MQHGKVVTARDVGDTHADEIIQVIVSGADPCRPTAPVDVEPEA